MASKAAQAQGLKAKEKTIQDEIDKFRSLQKDVQKCLSSKTQLEAQITENENVKKELDLLEADAVVFKLMGPVLVKQDIEEAKLTVQKRLDYIGKEIERRSATLKEMEKKQETIAEKLQKLQQDYQQAMTKAGITR